MVLELTADQALGVMAVQVEAVNLEVLALVPEDLEAVEDQLLEAAEVPVVQAV